MTQSTGRPALTLFAAALLLAVATPGAAQMSPRDILELPTSPADHRIAYGGAPQQFGELRLPGGDGPHPVAIVIHGGCWLSSFADVRIMDPVASALTGAGVATWNIEYRQADHPGGGWPGTFLDVGAGVDHVRTLAEEHDLDLARVVVIGHSAGGHLALWAAGRHRIPPSSPLHATEPFRPTGAVSLGGVADLIGIQPRAPSVCGTPVIDRLLGGTPTAVPERYAAASPRELLPLGTAQILITGTEDLVMLPEQDDAYVSHARETGDAIEMIRPEGAGHFEVIAPTWAGWDVVETAVLRLLQAPARTP